MIRKTLKLSTMIPIIVACVALPTGCTMMVDPKFQAQSRSHQLVEPDAGQWQTWVLTSLDEVRPAPPPDQAATTAEIAKMKALTAQLDVTATNQIAYWDAGSPGYRWLQLTIDAMQKHPTNPQRNDRILALVNVAVYDATVVAWKAKYTYNRPRPSEADPALSPLVAVPDSPSYPSEEAVAAGAASAVLAYLYPDAAQQFEAMAQEAGQSRVLAGVNYPSDVTAGLTLGQAVAAQVIAHGQADGSDAVWDGTMPTEAGHWTGKNPVEPLAGSWKPWVLTSTDQFRPGPPPAYDSPQEKTELQEIESYTHTFTSDSKAIYWQTFNGAIGSWYTLASQYLFESHQDLNPPQAARAYALMAVTQYDSQLACFEAKYTYWAMRPFMVDPQWKPLFATPNHPSYPAAHGCGSGAIAATMGYLFPTQAAALKARAEEAAWSRLWAGIHFRSDIEAGLALGRSVAQVATEHDATMIQHK